MPSEIVVTKREADLMAPAPLADTQQALATIRAFVASELKEGVDYGKIAGAGKPSMWKSGAEKLAMPLGLVADFVEESWSVDDPERLRFVISLKCVLTHYATGRFAGARRATAGADAYQRWGERTPEMLARGPHLADVIWIRNQALAMAQKRAYVAAIVAAGRLAADFTTDLEDAPDLAAGRQQAPPPAQPRRGRPPGPPKAAAGQPQAQGQAESVVVETVETDDVGPPEDWNPICGICGSEAHWQPPGVSKATGKPYNGFGACDNKQCRAYWNSSYGWQRRPEKK